VAEKMVKRLILRVSGLGAKLLVLPSELALEAAVAYYAISEPCRRIAPRRSFIQNSTSTSSAMMRARITPIMTPIKLATKNIKPRTGLNGIIAAGRSDPVNKHAESRCNNQVKRVR